MIKTFKKQIVSACKVSCYGIPIKSTNHCSQMKHSEILKWDEFDNGWGWGRLLLYFCLLESYNASCYFDSHLFCTKVALKDICEETLA